MERYVQIVLFERCDRDRCVFPLRIHPSQYLLEGALSARGAKHTLGINITTYYCEGQKVSIFL
jgi:hypothetical protein